MRVALLACALFGSCETLARDCQVEIVLPEAQDDLRPLLARQLDVARWCMPDSGIKLDEAGLAHVVARAPRQVAELLETEGYYSARAHAEIVRGDAAPVAQVVVTPGEPSRVSRLDLSFEGDIAHGVHAGQIRMREVLDNWTLRTGSQFRHADWEAAKRAALAMLITRAYPGARIAASRALVEPDRHAVHLHLRIDSGPRTTVGEVEILGLARYPDSVVRRVNTHIPGAEYDQAALAEYQKRLRSLPYFETVRVSLAGMGERAPIRVEVVEKRARDLSFGAGVSSDTGARGQIEYRDRNVQGRGLRMSHTLKLEQTGESLSSNLEIPSDASGYRHGLSLDLKRSEIEQLESRTLGLVLQRARAAGRFERTETLAYLVEREKAGNASVDRKQALVPGIGWIWHAVDRLEDPGHGLLFSLQLSGALESLLSDQSFARVETRATRFIELGPRDQLVVGLGLGAVWADSRAGIPGAMLFRTGGSGSVRGYDFESLGIIENGAVVGGRFLVRGSAEWVRWLSPAWGGALFLDAGDAADQPGDLDPALGYGFGVRWKSPLGRLGTDLAWGEREEQVRLHFAVGFAF